MENNKRYTLKELVSLVGITARNIRFYIQEGIIDKPFGQNRGAYYTDRHLQQLLTVKKYKEAGVSLERIRQIIHEDSLPKVNYNITPGNIEIVSRIHIMDGVELTINPELSRLTQNEIRVITKTILETIEKITKEKK